MIVNGIDIIGYDWVKFYRSYDIRYEIESSDILLYGATSTDFSYLFNIVETVDIFDSEYINISAGEISQVGSVSVQSNTADEILLNVILTDTDTTKIIKENTSVTIICNSSDMTSINLGDVSEQIKVLKLWKPDDKPLGNIRNIRISKDSHFKIPYYNEHIYSLDNLYYTNMNYTRALNKLNFEISKKLPEFTMVLGKRDKTNSKPNTIYCTYETMEIEHHKFLGHLRRNIAYKLEVNYDFRVIDDIHYAKLQYEMSNYDLITNICELAVNDDNEEIPWTFAIHWEIDPFTVDLFDPKTGGDNVGRSIKAKAEVHIFTSLDNYVADLKRKAYDVINNIEVLYKPGNTLVYIPDENEE